MKTIAQTKHYQIVDHGADWLGRFTMRYSLERKPEFERDITMKQTASANVARLLIPDLRAAEAFHIRNSRFIARVS